MVNNHLFICYNEDKGDNMEKAKVYFTKNITSENLIKLYELLDKKLVIIWKNLWYNV